LVPGYKEKSPKYQSSGAIGTYSGPTGITLATGQLLSSFRISPDRFSVKEGAVVRGDMISKGLKKR
jgi:hypothetical protein